MAGIREQGVVVAVDATGASVRIRPESEEHCASCGACGSGDRSGARVLRVPATEDLATGTRVVIQTAPVSVFSASLLLLLVPLVGLILGSILGQVLAPGFGLDSETGAVVGGISLLVLTYLAVTRMDRRIRARRGPLGPRIVEVTGVEARSGDPLDGPSPIG